jgi:hypothetical protein
MRNIYFVYIMRSMRNDLVVCPHGSLWGGPSAEARAGEGEHLDLQRVTHHHLTIIIIIIIIIIIMIIISGGSPKSPSPVTISVMLIVIIVIVINIIIIIIIITILRACRLTCRGPHAPSSRPRRLWHADSTCGDTTIRYKNTRIDWVPHKRTGHH